MKIAKKLLGIALAACMVLTMLPTAAFAYYNNVFENDDTFTLRTEALSGNITVADYTVGSTSVLWDANDAEPAKFNAWYPVYGNLASDVTVKSLNVSTSAKPDLMMAAPVTNGRTGAVILQFKHVMHRLVVNLSKDDSVLGNLNDAAIALKGMDGSASVDFTNGTVVGSDPGNAYPARANGAAIIVAPQTLLAGSEWITVTLGDYTQTLLVPTGSTNFISGKQTILNLQLQSDRIIFLSQTVMPWDANGDGYEDVSTVILDIASVPALTAPTNAGWANSAPDIAKWDAVDNASGYTVQLYKDSTLVETGFDAGTATEYNFASKIATTGNGDYIFNVQARGNGTTFPDSGWSGYSAKYVYVKPDQDQAAVDAFKLVLEGITWTTKENTQQNIEDDIDTKLNLLMGPPYYCDMQYQVTDVVPATPEQAGSFKVNFTLNKNAATATTTVNGTIDVLPPLPATVTSVTVSPYTPTVQKGATQQFTATVTGMNNPSQEVTWTVSGQNSANTGVSANGLLTVGADETSTILNVTAASTVDISKTSTAVVFVPSAETLANTLTLAGFTASASGNTVTVTGTKVATDSLSLKIPTGVKVLWKASLTGVINDALVSLSGDGTFELADGEITNTGTGRAVACNSRSIVISGGTASSASDVATVQTYHIGENAPTLTMTGGNVVSTSEELSSCAISAGGSTVITGGTITVANGNQVFLNNAVVVYRRDLLNKIDSKSLSASVAVSPSKTYAMPTETDGLTATGYTALADNVTAQWNYSNGGWTGIQVDYSGSTSGTWRVSYPAVQVVSGRHSLTYNANGGTGAATPVSTVYKGQSYTVSTNIFTRTNYTFTGWNTEADGTGTPYAEGATLVGGPGSEDIVLYAQWSSGSTVSNVEVNPTTAMVQKGMTFQFGAIVNGTNNPDQTVTWSVSGNSSIGTTISGGLLSIGSDETAAILTVKAISTLDHTKFSTSAVTVTQSAPTTDAQTPTITGQPVGATYTQGAAATALSVTASVTDGGTLSYQWYGSNNSELGGSPISGATTASFTPSTAAVGTRYYHVEVTNTKNSASGNKTASILSQPIAVTVQSSDNGGNGGGNGGGSYTPSTPPASNVVADKQPNQPTVAKQSVTGTMKDGALSVTITEQLAKDAIKAAQDAAKKSGKEVDGIALDFGATGSGSYANLNAALDAGAIDRLKEAGVKFVKIGSAVMDITLDIGAIAEIEHQSTGTVTVSAKTQTKLSKAAKKLIGNRPVFNITVSYQKNGKTETVSNFGKGAVTLGLAYKAADNENTSNLFAIYVDQNGKPQVLANSSYDNGRLIFSRNSLSTYGVGYKAPAPAFTDTAKHWAKDNIDFVASRNLISGTSATTFAPNTDITRADFLMALGRLSGANMSIYKTSSFTDVKTSDTVMPYIEWAVGNKIVSGYGNGKFGPNDLITREQMAVMMQNYARATGYKLPASVAVITFSDSAKISAYSKAGITAIQQAGIMQGKNSNTFDPQGKATRGEASTILRRFVELIIDEGTARGWNQNDAGQWQYIDENGKPAIGWLTDGDAKYYLTSDGIMVFSKWLEIDGKWYYFNADGSMAKNSKIGEYEVDENGVRKNK